MSTKVMIYLIILFMSIFVLTMGIFIGFSLQGSEKTIVEEFYIYDSDFNTSKIYIPGVDNRGEGVLALLETNIREGRGFVLVNIGDVTAGPATQTSARLAAKAAKNYLNMEEKNLDVIFNIKTEVDSIDGASAGAAMAITLISLFEDKILNENVSITGFVDENGRIMPAVGIEQKANALGKRGIETLLVSDQVALPRDYARQEICEFFEGREYCEINYISEGEINISGIKIVPVRDLSEAMEYFYVEE